MGMNIQKSAGVKADTFILKDVGVKRVCKNYLISYIVP